MSSLARQSRRAIQTGLQFVLERQAPDGFWRDYELQPGPSDVWATAWIGWCLGQCRSDDATYRTARFAAVRAVAASAVPGGWGYSRSTGADADSTAWACRLFAAHNAPVADMAAEVLEPFVDSGGSAHTFREAGIGSWGASHAEVTPMVGLALTEAGSRSPLIAALRRRVVLDQGVDGAWTSFWWGTNVYATAWSLVFLAQTTGIPIKTAARARRALVVASASDALTALERSLLLLAWMNVDPNADATLDLLDVVLSGQLVNGSWQPSALLLVPERFPERQSQAPKPHADCNALMTTAMTCAAIAAAMPAT